MSSSSAAVSSSSERFMGRVKWFNNKVGYGFITVTSGPHTDSDIFVHHSSVKVATEQYKYLVQGEYVEFTLAATTTADHEYQAENVSGIKGGKLMCETRNEARLARTSYHAADSEPESPRAVAPPKAVAPPSKARARGPGPREAENAQTQDKTWQTVPKKEQKRPRGRPTKAST
jgi:hypothetical protein